MWENWINKLSLLGMAFVVGWISCQSFYGLEALWVQKNQLAQTAAQAICDRGKARDLAGQLAASTDGDVSAKATHDGLKGCQGKVSPHKVPQVEKILDDEHSKK